MPHDESTGLVVEAIICPAAVIWKAVDVAIAEEDAMVKRGAILPGAFWSIDNNPHGVDEPTPND